MSTHKIESIGGHSIRVMWSQRDAAVRNAPQANVFVRALPPYVDQAKLTESFSQFGNILSSKVRFHENALVSAYVLI